MPDLKIVSQIGDRSKVFFGASVTLEKEDGEEVQYRIVGPDETNTRQGDISVDSPLAKALMKKEMDDEVSILIDGTQTTYYILNIDYQF